MPASSTLRPAPHPTLVALYIPAITLCILSREAYVLISASIGLAAPIDSRAKLFTNGTNSFTKTTACG